MAITQLRESIASQMIGRDELADVLALALVARDHVLVVGPPGTAKSMGARCGARAVSDAEYGEWLFSPTTPPEAVFGPISLKALREDRYEHVTEGTLATAHVAFLDEVGRASSALNDTLLHIMGPERQARIGTKQVKVPLISAIGAGNAWPEDAAALDRWLIRLTVNYLPPRERRALLTFQPPVAAPVVTLADLAAAHALSKTLAWTKAALAALDNIMSDLDDAGIRVSDRRFRAVDKIARAYAVLNGQTQSITPADLIALQYILWTDPSHITKTAEIVNRHAAPMSGRVKLVASEALDLDAKAAGNSHEHATVLAKLNELADELAEFRALPEATDPKAVVALDYAERVIAAVARRTNARSLGIAEGKLSPIPPRPAAL